ncbi:MAG TPA: hypothetical protein PLY87_11670 [Planctomycetaceae bacterium]|nr:hypothetical protein [Planctomycetaceae bacterium]HQZ65731.1 hypothetical protein [Planctomycetaceae bacterium]
MVALLNDQDSDVRSIEVVHVAGSLAQAREGWSDEQMLVDLEDDDSLARERSGIVLAYRRQQMNDNLPDPKVVERIKELRNDPRPWVKQSSLHALSHIENRKAVLVEKPAQPAN